MYEQLDLLQYFYGIPMEQADFMLNENHEIQYNAVCTKCRNTCKQSYKCQIIECPLYAGRRQRRSRRVQAATA